MAKATGKTKTRVTIKAQAMRELMFASGGWCAMTDCGLSLTSPTGGWIGTVAHIVGAEDDGPRGNSPLTAPQRAEDDGPRGNSPLTAPQRAEADNLILMCATHGREVETPDTGEANFPVERLRAMKEKHEAKVTEAVAAAIQQDKSGAPTATGAIDIGLRAAKAAVTADGLLESLLLDADAQTQEQFVAALDDARANLQQLSQLALDTLSLLLALWAMKCRTQSGTAPFDFGDPTDIGPTLPLQYVNNRVVNQSTFNKGYAELERANLIEIWYDTDAGTADYSFERVWQLPGRHRYNFWVSIAWFLFEGYGVEIQDWIKGVDFSILDRVAPANRTPPWRE